MSEETTPYTAEPVQDERGGLPSASLFPTLQLCRGKWNAIQALPPQVRNQSNPDADEGTARHTLLETGSEEYADDQQRKAVERARQLLEIAKRSIGIHEFTPDQVITEERLWYSDSTETRIFSGKYDRLEIYGGLGFMPDYKMMFSDYGNAKDSLQLAANAILACIKYNLDTVYVALIQPCLTRDKQISLAKYTIEELSFIALELEILVSEAHEQDAKRVAGIAQCKYCPAKASCKEAQANAIVTLEAALTGQSAGIMTSPVTADELDKIDYVLSIFVDGYAKQRWEVAKSMLENDPNSIPGRFLKSTGSTYEITDPEMARELVPEIPDKDFKKSVSVSFPKLAKAAKVTYGCKNDKEARELLSVKINPVLEVTEKAKSLSKR